MEVVRAKQIRGRIKALEGQIENLEMAMLRYRKWSRPWMMRRETQKRLEADIATLKVMLATLEPGGHASA